MESLNQEEACASWDEAGGSGPGPGNNKAGNYWAVHACRCSCGRQDKCCAGRSGKTNTIPARFGHAARALSAAAWHSLSCTVSSHPTFPLHSRRKHCSSLMMRPLSSPRYVAFASTPPCVGPSAVERKPAQRVCTVHESIERFAPLSCAVPCRAVTMACGTTVRGRGRWERCHGFTL